MSDINNTEAYAVFDSSDGSLTFFRDTPGLYTNNQVDGTKTYYTGIETRNLSDSSNAPWYSKAHSVTSITFEDVITPVSTAYWFSEMFNSSLITIGGLEKLDTSNVTDMNSMFEMCKKLVSIDVSHFDTSNVTNMGYMFYYCENLTSLDVNHFDTSNVVDMHHMFDSCRNLTSLDINHFNTSSVTDMNYMFYNCQNLTNLDVSHFDTSNVTNMTLMFYYCQNLTVTLNIMNIPTNYSSMCSLAATASGSQITLKYISPVTSANIDTLVATKSSSSNVINGGEGIFIPPKKIEKLFKISQSLPNDLEYISSTIQSSTGKNIYQTPIYDSQNHKVQAEIWSTDLDYAGEQITLSIKAQASDSIDLLQETKKTKIRVKDNMVYSKPIEKDPYAGQAYAVFDSSDGSLKFFRDDEDKYTNKQTNGTKTYYTGIETTNYASTSDVSWYSNRTSVTNVTFVDKIAPISTVRWFQEMNNASFTSITNLDKLDTSNVTNMTAMFSSCSTLTSLDLSNFNTCNVTDMNSMFNNCSALTSLDLSSFNTSNVTNMSDMLHYCTNLTTIYASDDWSVSGVTSSSSMFSNCSNLVGGNGTTYDSSIVDKTRAIVDGGSSNPGYLTYKAVSNNS